MTGLGTILLAIRVGRDHRPERLRRELHSINYFGVSYFDQLKEVDTENVEPMTGGTFQKNIFREDVSDIRREINATNEEIIEAFPEKENGLLKVPPVFE